MIPARLGATRLPRKPLRLLAGAPLVVQVWRRLAGLRLAERCVVATDSEEVRRAVSDAGGECVLTRRDHPSGTDRVAEVAARPEFARYDVVVNVQGDEPFIPASAVAGAAGCVESGAFELGTAAARARPEILTSPNQVKVVTADDGRALYFSRAGIPYLRDPEDTAARDTALRHHIGVYAYTRAALTRWVSLPPHGLELAERLEQLRPLAAGMTMGVATIEEPAPAAVDTEEDLERANAHWSHFIAGRG